MPVYAAWNQVKDDIRRQARETVPITFANAPTGLSWPTSATGATTKYAHDANEARVSQAHLPDASAGRVYYAPTDRGDEEGDRGAPPRLAASGATQRGADPSHQRTAVGFSAGLCYKRNSWLTSDCAGSVV